MPEPSKNNAMMSDTGRLDRAIRPVIAAAGGINPGNGALYAATGVDVLVSSWPYWAPPRDAQVTFTTT